MKRNWKQSSARKRVVVPFSRFEFFLSASPRFPCQFLFPLHLLIVMNHAVKTQNRTKKFKDEVWGFERIRWCLNSRKNAKTSSFKLSFLSRSQRSLDLFAQPDSIEIFCSSDLFCTARTPRSFSFNFLPWPQRARTFEWISLSFSNAGSKKKVIFTGEKELNALRECSFLTVGVSSLLFF